MITIFSFDHMTGENPELEQLIQLFTHIITNK